MGLNTIKDFNHIHTIEQLWDCFREEVSCVSYFKGQKINVNQDGIIAFVTKGLVTSFYVDDKKEICIDFFKEKDCLFDLAFLNLGLSNENILLCIEDTTIELISREAFDKVLSKYPNLNNQARMIFEHLYINLKRRLLAGYSQTPTERYQLLIKQSPDLEHRIPKRFLASYLNITAEALSRIRTREKLIIND